MKSTPWKVFGRTGNVALLLLCSGLGQAVAQTDPVPALITVLQGKENEQSEAALQAAPRWLKSPRAKAAYALGERGPAAKEAIPALIEALSDEEKEVQNSAAAALGRIGKAAVPLLIKSLANNDSRVREGVVNALQDMGEDAKPAVPALLKLVDDPNPAVREHAVSILGNLREAMSIRMLIEKLSDKNADVRRAAAGALSRFGPAAKDAIPTLIDALEDPDDFSARQDLFPPPRPTISGLLASRGVQEVAFDALTRIGAAAVPALLKLVKDPDRQRQRRAIQILGRMGPEGKMAVPSLIEKLEDLDPELRQEVALSLGRIGPEAKRAVPALANALHDISGEVRVTAATALKQIEPANTDAIPVLITEMQDKKNQPVCREEAFIALAKVGRGEKAVTAALIDAMTDSDEAVARSARFHLGQMLPFADEALTGLATALREGASISLRRKAADILTRVQDDNIAVSSLIETLQDNEVIMRNVAAEVLGALGVDAKPAIPALTKALTDNSPQVRSAAAKALEKIRAME